ncbi:hypothetical protein ADEAN_000373100 [Angomonas deanei]|uniref:Uncharacterized protein n=1 Tax=Angomonas deanei TaxID=59799 RepID=A0A7G2C8X8_9TRYP|nr:hypothetical protein ADEAN_000373100 [Angomonas deanei]
MSIMVDEDVEEYVNSGSLRQPVSVEDDSNPATPTETKNTHQSQFSRVGGNGLDKMAMLSYGKPTVGVVQGKVGTSPKPVNANTNKRKRDTSESVATQAKVVSPASDRNASSSPSDAHSPTQTTDSASPTPLKFTKTEPATASPPAKQQMKLSDFFTKMTCKR